jgi:hypothetical protein
MWLAAYSEKQFAVSCFESGGASSRAVIFRKPTALLKVVAEKLWASEF